MNRHHTKWMLLAVLVSSVANAAFSSPINHGAYGDTTMQAVEFELPQSLCTSACSTNISLSVPTGFSSAAVVLNNFNLAPKSPTGGIKSVKLVFGVASYNATTGSLDLHIEADYATNPSSGQFYIEARFTILLANNSTRMVTEKVASAFSSLSAPNCDTSDYCADTTTLTGVATASIRFQTAFLRGFSLSTADAAGISLNDFQFGLGYVRSGNTAASGQSTCYLGSSAAHDVDCSVYIATVAGTLNTAYVAATSVGVTGITDAGTTVGYATTGSILTSQDFVGLQTLEFIPSSSYAPAFIGGGCLAYLRTTSMPSTSQMTFTGTFDFRSGSGTAFDGYADCSGFFW